MPFHLLAALGAGDDRSASYSTIFDIFNHQFFYELGYLILVFSLRNDPRGCFGIKNLCKSTFYEIPLETGEEAREKAFQPGWMMILIN